MILQSKGFCLQSNRSSAERLKRQVIWPALVLLAKVSYLKLITKRGGSQTDRLLAYPIHPFPQDPLLLRQSRYHPFFCPA